jgi:LPS-assembly protein
VAGQGASRASGTSTTQGSGPIDIQAEHLEFQQTSETYRANGSVVITQGTMRLTADEVTMHMLTGTLTAVGHAHLTERGADLWAERLQLDINTDSGVLTNGKLFVLDSNTFVEGRLLQRFSEDHIRAKEGSFTNCDAKDGQTPAWRFTFKDVDLNLSQSLYAKDVWFCVNDVKLVPLPTLTYPIQTARQTGLLIPTVGYDSRFGMHFREGLFYAINPSQDLMVTPELYTNRGYGGDLAYRYTLDRQSKGQWLISFLQDTEVNKARATITGNHVQRFSESLSLRVQANFLTDRSILEDLSNSSVLRALPSQESNVYLTQRLSTGNLYMLGQFLQPVGVGGKDSFQRMPEFGYRMIDVAPLGGPFLMGLDTTLANFYREEGFALNRVDFAPSFSMEPITLNHVVGITPQVRLRETYYTRGVQNQHSVHRETLWMGIETNSRLARRYQSEGHGFLHTLEPRLFYEYVPPTEQSNIVQVDDVDDLKKKNLLTYSLRSRFLETGGKEGPFNWLDLTLAQSYHVGETQTQARQFPFAGTADYTTITQQIQPTTVAVQGRKFSDLWVRAVVGNTTAIPGTNPMSLTVDAFFNPYRGGFSQWNTDLRYQSDSAWYMEIGQRFARDGNRVRRGDIWNPLSFNEVYAPTAEVQFLTAAAGVRLPHGWTVGARTYYDVKEGKSPEVDVVSLYQNPCRCWSLGLFYLKFPDRTQYNFLISLTGLGATESVGTQVVRTLLGPLLREERGLPWNNPTAKRPVPPETQSSPGDIPPLRP